MGLALAIKDALRAGALSLPHSQPHVSFWDLTLSDTRWQEVKTSAYDARQQPPQHAAKAGLTQQCHEARTLAKQRCACDDCAAIEEGKRTVTRDDNIAVPPAVTTVQKVIQARLPVIRSEPLLLAGAHRTGFRRHCTPVPGHQARPPHV